MINSFTDAYACFSNFYMCEVGLDGLIYRNAEAAFQSAKYEKIKSRNVFKTMAPSTAKLKGRQIKNLRKDWEQVKDGYMYKIVKDKFTRNLNLQKILLDTQDEELIEGNTWHDNYWGNCYCERCKEIKGKNQLGKILMRVREEIRKNKEKIND